MKIQNATTIVTGGAKGLGLSIAEYLKAKEANVIILDIDKEALDNLSDDFVKYHVDLTNYTDVQTTIDNIVSKYQKIDVLINNAGKIYNEPLINISNPQKIKHSYEAFKNIIDINLNSVFIITSIVAEKMVFKRTMGAIVNISSISAYGNAGQTAYSAAKAAVIGLTKTWAKELGVFKIRTNAIAPGFINTQSTQDALNEEILKHIKQNTPLRKLGNAEDVAGSVLFAIENDFLNGAIIDVNGGITI